MHVHTPPVVSVDAGELHELADRHVLHSLRRDRRLIFARGQGCHLWDVEGREYLDAISGTNGPALVGHCHPHVSECVSRQLTELSSTFLSHLSIPVVEFGRRLAAIAPAGLTQSYLCPGGGEAVEAAVKLAMRITGRSEAIALQGSYHGMSLGMMSLGGIPALREWFPGGVRWPTFYQVPGADPYRPAFAGEEAWSASIRALEAALDGGTYRRVAAIVVELVQGPGGHIELPHAYVADVQRICRERGILFIVDEVQTALGRCGALWATDLYGVKPDLLTVGKAFGGGFPFGALLIRPDLIDESIERDPWNILTFQNQPLQAAAGLAVLDIVQEERLDERAQRLGVVARRRFESMAERYQVVGDVRGPGLFVGVDLVRDRESKTPATEACTRAYSYALDHGLITWFGGAGNVLKFKPPLTSTDEEIDEMLARCESVIAFVEHEVYG
jgi:2,2-dialkylglycine decarboxylase (pyruvate)